MSNLSFDYRDLRGEIRKKFETEAKFAKIIGVSPCVLSAKFNGKSHFSNPLTHEIIKTLDLKATDIPTLFFTEKVCENTN